MSRSKLLITLGLILLMTLPAAVVYAGGHGEIEGSGSAVISDGAAMSDKVTFTLTGVTALDTEEAYEGWLINSASDEKMSVGVLGVVSGKINHTWTSPDGANLLAMYDSVAVTVEPVPDDDPMPSADMAFMGSVDAESLAHIRHLVVAWPEDGDMGGILTQLQMQIGMAMDEIAEAQAADDVATLRAEVQAAVDIIDAEEGGILALAKMGDEHAGFGSSPATRQFASKVRDSSVNVALWAMDAKEQSAAVMEEDSLDVAKVLLNIVNGRLDAAQNGTANKDGAKAAYMQAQQMATFTLSTDAPPPPDEGPDVGDAYVPVAMQLMLIAALALIVSGGVTLYRTRRQSPNA